MMMVITKLNDNDYGSNNDNNNSSSSKSDNDNYDKNYYADNASSNASINCDNGFLGVS